jgi:hypothetical protein
LHNNSLGPELCGRPVNKANNFYRSPYVDASNRPLPPDESPDCWPFDPSVEGRFELYVASMRELLNPGQRLRKLSHLAKDVRLALGPRIWDGEEKGQLLGFTLQLPAHTSVGGRGNFQHKEFVNDVILARLELGTLEKKLVRQFGEIEGKKIAGELSLVAGEIAREPEGILKVLKTYPRLTGIYSSCTANVENEGHRFGEDLSDDDKNALIAFLATL